MLKVTSLYATDFGELSPGGIRNVVTLFGREAPPEVSVSYIGMGPLAGPLPKKSQRYVGLGDKVEAKERSGVNTEFLKRLQQYKRFLRQNDVVIIHRAEHALVVPRGVPIVFIAHGGTWNALNSGNLPFGLAYPVLEALAAKRSELMFSVAPDQHFGLLRHLANIYPTSSTYDERLFRPASIIRRRDERPTLVIAARLVREKRIERVIKAAVEVSAKHLHIFGSGPQLPALQAMASLQQIPTTFHGQCTPTELSLWYKQNAAVFVLTSDFEGYPVALLEAAGSGVPVAGLKGPGMLDAVNAVGGQLADSESELPQAIMDAWSDGNRRDGRWIAANFGSATVADRFWRKLLSKVGSSGRHQGLGN